MTLQTFASFSSFHLSWKQKQFSFLPPVLYVSFVHLPGFVFNNHPEFLPSPFRLIQKKNKPATKRRKYFLIRS